MTAFLLKDCVALHLEVRRDTHTPSEGKAEQRGRLQIFFHHSFQLTLHSLLILIQKRQHLWARGCVSWFSLRSTRMKLPVLQSGPTSRRAASLETHKLYSICADVCVVFSFLFLCGHLVTLCLRFSPKT